MANGISISDGKGQQPMTRRRLFLIAVAYFCMAMLPINIFGLGTAPFLFPPSGIAIGAALVWGTRIWPAIFLGGFSISMFQIVLVEGNWGLSAWAGVLSGGVSALLELWAGYWMGKRLLRGHDLFRNWRDSFSLTCVIAPTAALLGSASMFAGQLFVHHGSMGDTLWVAFIWWIGVALGIIVFTPLTVHILTQTRYSAPKFRNRVFWAFGISMILSCVMVYAVYDLKKNMGKMKFEHDASVLTTRIASHLQERENELLSLRDLLISSPELPQEKWQEAILPWMESHLGATDFGYAAYVRQNERAEFEAKMRRRGLHSFRIWQRDNSDHRGMFPVEMDFFLPYIYIAPSDGNQDFIGFDAYLGSARNKIFIDSLLKHQLDSRRVWARRGKLPWQAEHGTQDGILFFQAVFDDKHQELLGLIVSGVSLDDLMQLESGGNAMAKMELCLADPMAQGEQRHIFGASGCEKTEWEKQASRFPVWRASLSVGSQQWELHIRTLNQDTSFYLNDHSDENTLGIYTLCSLLIIVQIGCFILYAAHIRNKDKSTLEQARLLKQMQSDLIEQENLSRKSQEILLWGYWEQGDTYFRASDNLRKMLGFAPEELSDWEHLLNLLPVKAQNMLKKTIVSLYEQNSETIFDSSLEDKYEREIFVRFYLTSTLKKNGERRIQGIVQDLTQETQYEQRIHHMIHHDCLTQLPSELEWDEQTKIAMAQAHEDKRYALAILAIGVASLENIATTHGYPAYKTLLIESGRRIQETSSEDAIITRQGNIFFCCLPKLKNISESARLANNLLANMKEKLLLNHCEIDLSANIGIALFPENGHSLEALQKNACAALCAAKSVGKESFRLFETHMEQSVSERLVLENALRAGILHDELELYYQPQIHTADGRAKSCEALVRWNHPDEGLISPARFIPLAEETGQILPLGRWVFIEACLQQVRWAESGITIAVNISAIQFHWEHFVDITEKILTDTGANPKYIELEITESSLMNLDEAILERIYRLKSMGFEFSLDDFGTGYSSLSYLKRLPISRLKLDQSFVRDLPGNADSCSIASATILMSKALGMEVVAEGVETVEQVKFLKEHGCDILQGYYFGKPMDASRYEAWLKEFDSSPAAAILQNEA